MDCHFEPMESWPRNTTVNRKSGDKFQAAYSHTLTDLDYELTKLRAKDIVIQIGLDRQHIRNDGLPRSNAPKPWHPGIIVSFTSTKGQLRFLCDTYTSWKANLRAITKLLERLRLLDLDGVAQDDEPYRGWQALPPGEDSSVPASDVPEATTAEMKAALFIGQHSGKSALDVLHMPDVFKAAHRLASRKLHPDFGGNHAEMSVLNESAKLLKVRHGL